MTELLSVEEAQRRILAVFQPVSTRAVSLHQAAGLVLSEEISASLDLPPFTNSGMDGFAVRTADTENASADHPVRLKLVADIPAGSFPSITIQPGQAARIMTGAAFPNGADAVVPIENTDLQRMSGSDLQETVQIFHPAKPGEYLRFKGQDVRQGVVLLSKGRRLLPQDVGLLATVGLLEAPVYRQPRVALLSSGDELVEPGQTLGPGKIYDSNSYTLSALARQYGAEMLYLGVARDDPEDVKQKLQVAVQQKVDLIITSAGVSVGAFDYVRAILEEQGKLTFWRVNMRPGKPLAFGSYEGIPVIGLPGNPVSAFVGFLIFVIPVLQKLSGREGSGQIRARGILDEAVESDGRESYLRAIARYEDGRWHVKLSGNQSSGNLYSLVQANALLIVPSGVKSLPIGIEVEMILLSGRDIE